MRLWNPGRLGFADDEWKENVRDLNTKESCWNVAHFMNMAQLVVALMDSPLGQVLGPEGCADLATALGVAWEAFEQTGLAGFSVDMAESREDVGFFNAEGIDFGLEHADVVRDAMQADDSDSPAIDKLVKSAVDELTSPSSVERHADVIGSRSNADARANFLKRKRNNIGAKW